jgi:arylsulfatase A-like enzyme
MGPVYADENADARGAPNIIYILADDLGYGDLGCYGQQQIQTPHLDRLAAEGMRFTQHYAGATVCAPSRCVLMTGMHIGHAQVRGNRETKPMGQWPLAEDTVTAARLLQQAGYATALAGKWGLGGPDSTGHPNRQGFDFFFGYLCQRHAHNYYPEYLFRNDERVPLGNEISPAFASRGDGAGVAAKKVAYSHDVVMDEAMKWLDQNKERQFFLYLTPTIPHANNEGRQEGMEVPSYGIYQSKNWPQAQRGLAAMITRLDDSVGRLITALREWGIENKTLVMFSSDNGPHAEGGNDPTYFSSSGSLRGKKRDLYEGGIRVPLIAWWPGRIAAGQESSHISGFQDMLPTFAELAGVTPPDTDGISMVPTLTGTGAQQRHPYLYWEFHEQGGKQAVRAGHWKAVRLNVKRDRSGPLELYDVSNDLGETNDVAGQHPDVVRRMERIMSEARTDSEVFPF